MAAVVFNILKNISTKELLKGSVNVYKKSDSSKFYVTCRRTSQLSTTVSGTVDGCAVSCSLRGFCSNSVIQGQVTMPRRVCIIGSGNW